MKHYKNAIIHGAKLFRHLKGLGTASDNGLPLATLPIANGAAARAWTHRRIGERAEEGDDFFGALAATLGGGGDEDESGGGFLSAFMGGGMGGGEEESGDDLLSAFMGGDMGGGEEESGDDFLSAFLGGGTGGGEEESGDDFFGLFRGSGGDDSEGDGGLFSELLDEIDGLSSEVMEEVGEFMEHFEQCGIDLPELSNKALMAFFTLGTIDVDITSFLDFSAFQPIFLALKDDDEEECSDADEAALTSASEEYLKCTGMNDFFDDSTMTPIGMQGVEEDCKPVYNMISTGDVTIDNLEQDFLNEESSTGKSTMRCLKATLGDNEIGNFIRYEYNNVDKEFECLSSLGAAMPHCLRSFSYQDDKPVSLPLSLWKKAACLLGSSYKSIIEGICVGIYEELDTCLPQDGEDFDDSIITLCSEKEGLPLGKIEELFGMDASILTGNDVIPDFCSRVFEEKAMDATDIRTRLDYYNENREYGWTFESIAAPAPVDANSAADEIPLNPVPGEAQESTFATSNSVGISGEENESWMDGETTSDDASSQKHFTFLVAGLLVIGAATLALIVKYRGALGASRKVSPMMTSSDIAGKHVKAIDAGFA